MTSPGESRPAVAEVEDAEVSLEGFIDVLRGGIQGFEKFFGRDIRLLEFYFDLEFPSRRFKTINERFRSSRRIDEGFSGFARAIARQSFLTDLLVHRSHRFIIVWSDDLQQQRV